MWIFCFCFTVLAIHAPISYCFNYRNCCILLSGKVNLTFFFFFFFASLPKLIFFFFIQINFIINCFSFWVSQVWKVKVIQWCPTLCKPVDYTVHRILQARILLLVAFLFSRGSSQYRDWTRVSCIAGRVFTSWAIRSQVVHQLSYQGPGGSMAKNLPANAGDLGRIPGSGRYSREENGNPL